MVADWLMLPTQTATVECCGLRGGPRGWKKVAVICSGGMDVAGLYELANSLLGEGVGAR